MSLVFEEKLMLLARGSGDWRVEIGASHRRVVGSRSPVSRMVPREVMIWTCLLSNIALHPASQSCPTDRRERFSIAGKICASSAAGSRCGRLRKVLVVAVMVLPFGRLTSRGSRVETWLGFGTAELLRKCPVAPVSIIARGKRAGGPSVSIYVCGNNVGLSFILAFLHLYCSVLGALRSHNSVGDSMGEGGTGVRGGRGVVGFARAFAALWRRSGRCHVDVFPLRRLIKGQPPCM